MKKNDANNMYMFLSGATKNEIARGSVISVFLHWWPLHLSPLCSFDAYLIIYWVCGGISSSQPLQLRMSLVRLLGSLCDFDCHKTLVIHCCFHLLFIFHFLIPMLLTSFSHSIIFIYFLISLLLSQLLLLLLDIHKSYPELMFLAACASRLMPFWKPPSNLTFPWLSRWGSCFFLQPQVNFIFNPFFSFFFRSHKWWFKECFIKTIIVFFSFFFVFFQILGCGVALVL